MQLYGDLRAARVMLVAALVLGCDSTGEGQCLSTTPVESSYGVTLAAVDELGDPVAGARVEAGDGERPIGRLDGLLAPVVAVVRADGYLAEPVVVGPADRDTTVTVRLFAAQGGKRWAMHSAGDVMFGRRYEAPTDGEPLIPASDARRGAERVVSAIARLFGAADLRTVNLETVVTDRPDTEVQTGKRYTLRSRPQTLAALNSLRVSVATLANNHARDYLEPGIGDTIANLAQVSVPFVGATPDTTTSPTYVAQLGATRVGVAGFCTVDGTYINDGYPGDDAPAPATVDPRSAFLYELRTWGFDGAQIKIPTAARRIGAAWRAFKAEEAKATSQDDIAAAWSSAMRVYPELQDTVARRGHGGANPWTADGGAAIIAELRKRADVVVVQLHAGIQYQEAPASNAIATAHAMIDAGADMVIAHHPHVVQGFHWYRGKLIAFSLGNFVFDEDFLSTFGSVILRTVWDGATLLEARLLPIEIDAYRPYALAGDAARRGILTLWERSQLRAVSKRVVGTGVHMEVQEPSPDTVLASVSFDGSSARLIQALPAAGGRALRVEAHATAPLGLVDLVDPRLGLSPGASPGIFVGRDLFGWGRFERELAGDSGHRAAHWSISGCDEGVAHDDEGGHLVLRRADSNLSPDLVRSIARISLTKHRFVSSDALHRPLDPGPSYSVRLRSRSSGDGEAFVRAVLYSFDDSDTSEDPVSTKLDTLDFPFDPRTGDIEVRIPADKLGGDAAAANMVLLYIGLEPPRSGSVRLEVDDVMFVEWRRADAMPSQIGAYEFVRNDGDAPQDLQIPFWSGR